MPFWHKIQSLSELEPKGYLWHRSRLSGGIGKATLFIIKKVEEDRVRLLKISMDNDKEVWYTLAELRNMNFLAERDFSTTKD